MHMIGHNYPGMQHKPFVFDTKLQTFDHDLFITFSTENINPRLNGFSRAGNLQL
jgi:hypothetical protein